MEARGIGCGLADFLSAPGRKLVRAADLLAVIPEEDATLVDEPERADVAVVARLQPARIIVFVPLDADVLDAFAESARQGRSVAIPSRG